MKQIGLARLGRDAEIRYLPDGTAVANLSLAVNYGQKGADGNRPTQWIDATLWGKSAEVLAPMLRKGDMHCFVLSDVHIEEYEGRNGPGVKLAARCDGVELTPRNDGGQQANQQRSAPAARPASPAPAQPARQAPAPRPASGFDDMEDDIPF